MNDCPTGDQTRALEDIKWPYLCNASSDPLRVWFYGIGFSNKVWTKSSSSSIVVTILHRPTVEDVYDDTGDIIVRTTTRILSGVGHFAVPHRQHADQRWWFRFLCDDETRLRIRHNRSSVLEPVDVRWRISLSGHVTDELNCTSSRYVFTSDDLDCYKSRKFNGTLK